MRIILLADVKKVGRKHEIVTVADGYAQNVLLPKKLALPATPENLKRFEKEKGMIAEKQAFSQSLLEKNIRELDGKTLAIPARANEAGTLFQTLHKKQIVEAIEKEFGICVPEDILAMNDIKQKGEYPVTLAGGEAEATLIFSVR